MVTENAISLPPQQAAVLEAFLQPGFSVPGVARQMGLPIAAVLEILTSAPVAAALDTIRQLQHDHLEMAQTAAFAAATDALSKLLPAIQDTREIRRSATAILRSIRPARAARRTADYTTRHAAAPALSSPRERERPVDPRPPASDTSSANRATSTPAPVSSGGFQGGRALMECISTGSPFAHEVNAQHANSRSHRSSGPAARLAAAAGISGPAP